MELLLWFATWVGLLVILRYTCTLLAYLGQGIRVLYNIRTDLVVTYGEWAVVTGCTDGIGLAYARALARRGVSVALLGRGEVKLRHLAAQIEKEFKVKTKVVVVDFTGGQEIYDRIGKELHDIPVGILVNNVGVMYPYPMRVEELSDRLVWEHVAVNMAAATQMSRLVLPDMKARRRGAIVNLCSVVGINPVPYLTVYCATKAYLRHLTLGLHFECRGSGVRVQALFPGYVNTRMVSYSAGLVRASGLLVPSAERYAAHALATLGAADCTAGYFMHEFKAWFASEISPRLWMALCGPLYASFRLQHLRSHPHQQPASSG